MNGEVRAIYFEDEPEVADMTRTFLEAEHEDWVVDVELDAEMALERLDSREYDCVISDYDMPAMNGIELLEFVRERYPELPFILFTGKGSEEVASEAISAGVSDYLQKGGGSGRYALLSNRIENAVEQYRSNIEIERTERRYHRMIEEANDVIMVVDPNGRFEYVSPAAGRILGYEPDELVGEVGFEYVHPDDLEHTSERFFEMIEDPDIRPVTEFRLRRPDGSWMWLEVLGRNLTSDPAIRGLIVYARDITERKEREREIEQYRTLVENVADPMYILDAEDGIEMVNAAFKEDFGYDREEVIGRPIWEVLPTDGLRRNEETMATLLGDTQQQWDTFEMTVEGTSGEERLYETKLAALTEDGTFAGSIGVFRDITERHAHQRALQRERDRLESLFENLPNPVVHVDMTTGEPVVKQVNSEFEETFGFAADAVIGEKLDEVTVPDDREAEAEALNEQILEDGKFRAEVARKTAEGLRDFVMNGVLRDPDSETPEGYAIYTDISDRKRREEELETIHERMAFGLDATDSYIFEIDTETGTVTRHGVFERLYGLCEAEIPTTEEFYDRAVHPAHREELQRLHEEGLLDQQGEPGVIEYRTHPETDEQRWLRSAAYVHVDNPHRMIGLATDVTARKQRERELAKTTAKLQALVSAFPDLTVLKDSEGNELETFSRRREAGEPVARSRPMPAEKREVDDIFPPEQVEEVRSVIRRAIETGSIETIEYRIGDASGDRWYEARIAPVDEPIDDEEVVVWVARDITSRKEREHELQRQNERLNEFTSLVSHDLRNPLNIAKGHLQLLEAEDGDEHLNVVSQALDRMGLLVEDLLTLARDGELSREMAEIDLETLVEDCWMSVGSGAATVRIDTDQTIVAHRYRLQQLLENLMRNAVEHVGDDVTVSVGKLPDGDGFYVEDDGDGIPTDDSELVFDRGYTTIDRGTGYGLSIVEEVAVAHGWEVTLTAAENGGARFEISNVKSPA